MVSTAGVSAPNSPSQRAITTEARQLPTTLTLVRAISMSASIPRITKIGSSGSREHGHRRQQNNQRCAGHAGHTFAGQHQRAHHEDLLLPAHGYTRGLGDENRRQRKIECRTIQIEAVAGGDDKATILRGTPNASIASMARGSAASEVLVANAIVAGSATARKNLRMGTPAISATGSIPSSPKASSAPIKRKQ